MTSVKDILAGRGLAALKARGQNFLADTNAARAIAEKSGFDFDKPVVEIGPGLGGLTRPLLEAGHRVVAVEVDSGLADYLDQELVPHFPELTVVRADALTLDLADLAPPPLQVTGNLPFNISTPLLVRLMDQRDRWTAAALMFQKEVARRLTAPPRTKDYGRLAVLCAHYFHVSTVATFGPEVFHPRPKVSAQVVRVAPKTGQTLQAASDRAFRRTVAAAFSQRRKTLANSLRSAYPKPQIDHALTAAGIDPHRRAETLTVEELVTLSNFLT